VSARNAFEGRSDSRSDRCVLEAEDAVFLWAAFATEEWRLLRVSIMEWNPLRFSFRPVAAAASDHGAHGANLLALYRRRVGDRAGESRAMEGVERLTNAAMASTLSGEGPTAALHAAWGAQFGCASLVASRIATCVEETPQETPVRLLYPFQTARLKLLGYAGNAPKETTYRRQNPDVPSTAACGDAGSALRAEGSRDAGLIACEDFEVCVAALSEPVRAITTRNLALERTAKPFMRALHLERSDESRETRR